MKVSVIVPVYNVEKYLEKCLDSILGQTFHDYEVICVEDCSIDDSCEILKKFQQKDSRFKIVQNEENKGLSCSRNNGMRHAKGEYILFVDSDDYLLPTTLEKLYETSKEYKLDILYFNKRIIYDESYNGEMESETTTEFFPYGKVCSGREMFSYFLEQKSLKSMNAYTQFFYKDFLTDYDLKFYEGILHEDFYFFFLCAMNARRVFDVNEPYYFYRKRNNSITSNISEVHKQSVYITIFEILNYWKNHMFSTKENEAIGSFLDVIFRNYSDYRREINNYDELQFGTPAEQWLYRKIEKLQYTNLTNDEWKKIQNQEYVWIYGAGDVGREIAIIMGKNDIQVRGYLVSDIKGNREKLFGWPIVQFDASSVQQNDLIIIAIYGRKKYEVSKALKECGYMNIIYAVKG